MSDRIRVRPQAVLDIDRIAGFIRRWSPQNAARFIDRAYEAMDRLDQFPEACGLLVPGDAELGSIRCGRIQRHPNHLVLFRVVGDVIRILRKIDARHRSLSQRDLADLPRHQRGFTRIKERMRQRGSQHGMAPATPPAIRS